MVGDLVMKAGAGDSIGLKFYSPTPRPEGNGDTVLIQKVVEIVKAEGRELSISAIETLFREKGIRASNAGLRGAIDLAAGRGLLIETPGARGARLFTYAKGPENES